MPVLGRLRLHLLPAALLIAGGAVFGFATAPSGAVGDAAYVVSAAADTIAVATADEAISIALGYIRGEEPAGGIDVLFGGARASDTGRYWIVTVTRDALSVLDRPRLIAVDKFSGKPRDLFPDDHDGEHQRDGDRAGDSRSSVPDWRRR